VIRSVVFDVGETLIDDTREFGAWADWLGVPRHTFSAVLGAVTAAGLNNAETFQVLRPGFDLEAGLWVGIAGNQTIKAAGLLRVLNLPVDAIVTSGEWGVTKPHPAFFEKVVELAPGTPNEIVYVGDHRDNDIVPARAAGLLPVLIRRGPWGHLWADHEVVVRDAEWVIDSLTELPGLVGRALRNQ
jgi:FMN phosphatase YigB (HAD superfamily)